ncbi:beta-N-acetylhexosaminidase [Candidatus Parcubacteria bacterium]|jgi:beta-N-acetylhexosaminidase|nr:beta-N-acetylhexosaminidase [Candidatus Parcubacteria bacterium]
MKKLILILIILVALGLVYFLVTGDRQVNDQATEDVNTLATLDPGQMLENMTLEDKVGQMLMVGFWGPKPDYYISKMINQRNIGGVILMKYNFVNQGQTKELIDTLQEMSLETNPGIPLFVSVDQEGGVVSRLKIKGVEEFTPQAEIDSEEQAYATAVARAKELKALGINVNYSPVLDIIDNFNSFLYNRVFRGSLEHISVLAQSMVTGYQDNDIIAVPKHFPGHDNGSIDSHQDLPTVYITKTELGNSLQPFKDVIRESEPKMIMVGHIVYENIDKGNPSSLSKVFIQDILKDQLGYNGVVITDDMEMGALINNYSNVEAAVKAIQAGNDILLYTSTPEKQAEAYNAIIQAVNDGEISMEQIDASVLKILKLKKEI